MESLISLSWEVLKLVLIKFLASTRDQSHHLLVKIFLQKRMLKSRCYKYKISSMLFAANVAVEQEVNANTRSIEAE